MPLLTDSHAHLDAREFDADRAAVLARARAAGIAHQIVPAVNAAGWEPLRALCADAPDLHPAYGLHPMYLADHAPQHLHLLADWLRRERAVAIGECGLDFFIEGLAPDAQRAYFLRQLELAREFALPVIVHARRALDEVIATLRRVGGLRGVVHSFSGSEVQARELWKLGFRLGIGGPVTYPRAQRLRRIVAAMPLEHLLLETDAPDQPGIGHRGQRNEPAHLVEVLDCVAALRGVEPEALAAATTRNAEELFGLA
ncbi:MAG: TatD family hydrolase [Mizugakiibacter sp.]|uniref:TatD family hydrolase n=1 Tax=Mizugakiibacter sp. TaxID=1972610 RepID=UPI0031C7010E|nr:TatD family hydrolase [Xanthomonadaceae bacterium]